MSKEQQKEVVSYFVLYKDSSLVRSNARSMTAEMEEERGQTNLERGDKWKKEEIE